MKKINSILVVAMTAIILTAASCKKDKEVVIDEPTASNLNMNFSGLEDLGSDYAYEGWLIVDGAPVSAGIFTVDASGNPSATSFEIDKTTLENATAYVLTIEPSPDADPAPSKVHILAGDFNGNTSTLAVDHASAIATDFVAATGKYILATPTDGGAMDNEESGVWWIDPAAGPGPGLSLPALPEGWEYEGWAVVNGIPLSTGKFTTASGSDDAAPFSGVTAGPPFPGEDFLRNAPTGLTFPIDLSGKTVVISVEPKPDNSPAPFLLKPLVSVVPAAAMTHSAIDMSNNAEMTNPTGTATR
jgi:hypothetical protein